MIFARDGELSVPSEPSPAVPDVLPNARIDFCLKPLEHPLEPFERRALFPFLIDTVFWDSFFHG